MTRINGQKDSKNRAPGNRGGKSQNKDFTPVDDRKKERGNDSEELLKDKEESITGIETADGKQPVFLPPEEEEAKRKEREESSAREKYYRDKYGEQRRGKDGMLAYSREELEEREAERRASESFWGKYCTLL